MYKIKTINPNCIWCGKKKRKFMKMYCSPSCWNKHKEMYKMARQVTVKPFA